MVGAPGVVEHPSVGEFPVEEDEIGEQQVFGIVDEGFRKGAMEAFGRNIIFGVFGVGRPTGDPLFREDLGEAGLELGAVVRQEHPGRLGQERQGGFEGGLGLRGDWPGRATAEAKALAGSMKLMRSRRMPSRTRSRVSVARHGSGAGLTPWGFRDLR